MNISTIKRIAVIILLCLGASTALYAGRTHFPRNGSVPIEISTSPMYPSVNQSVSITVTLSAEASSDQLVATGCLNPYGYTNLPSEVTVPAGYSSVSFYATTSGTYQGSDSLAATCNGGTAISGGDGRPYALTGAKDAKDVPR